ncbi:Actin- protein 6 [Coniosporium apollinis]|uniref:Actin- protein 6 n=1 Tax=Coniosporium apollinis TaxID=61459 RepID=A0ABQ9NUT4_9PEZI|nr:Actin- protein 6 [Coniosporium apollinis]
MPRQIYSAEAQQLKDRTLVVDNGAYTIKAGFASPASAAETPACHIIPNCIARSPRDKKTYIASDLAQCRDFGELAFRRPMEKGFIVNWESERAIWEHSFFDEQAVLKCDPHETNLVLTEAPNCPLALQTNCDQMVFEEFEFGGYYRCLGPSLNAYNDIPALFSAPPSLLPTELLLLIDSGYSHTTITPLLSGRPLHPAIRRLDIGGKHLTNYLKETISTHGTYDVMDETHLINQVKEDACYVSSSFAADLEKTWKGGQRDAKQADTSIVVDYVLPDYENVKRGFMRPHDPAQSRLRRAGPVHGPREDVLPLGNERFSVPELLFEPRDVGLREAGLPELVMQCLEALPVGLRPAMLANVAVVGGNALIKGFVERLEREIRARAPAEWVVRMASPEDPITYTWNGGARFASDRERLKSVVVTREEYLEHGVNLLRRRWGAK